MTATSLVSKLHYSGTHMNAAWYGRVVDDIDCFKSYVTERVRTRVNDNDVHDPFDAELRSMATTGMQTDFVEQLLRAVPAEKSWAIGEALGECTLADDDAREVCWPWNLVRDRRTPRASLPGADLVGFCKEGDSVLLLLGEVKTSSDSDTPPNVMHGGEGMVWQLEEEATRLDIQHALLKWLRCRCVTPQHLELYKAAVQRYVQSQGKEILLVGVLLRDTKPSESDLKARAKALAAKLSAPTRIEIMAWYLPVPIKDWPALL